MEAKNVDYRKKRNGQGHRAKQDGAGKEEENLKKGGESSNTFSPRTSSDPGRKKSCTFPSGLGSPVCTTKPSLLVIGRLL